MPDRLTIFAWLLAFANVAHQLTYERWIVGEDTLGLPLFVAAVALLLRPGSIALLLLLVTSAFVFLGWIPWIWLGSLGVVAIIYGVQPLMPKRDPNHRVPLIGSRFSPG